MGEGRIDVRLLQGTDGSVRDGSTGASVTGFLIDNLHRSRSSGTIDELRVIVVDRFPYLQFSDAGAAVPTEFMALFDKALNGHLLPGEGATPIEELLPTVSHGPVSFGVRSRALYDDFTDPVERARYLLRSAERLGALGSLSLLLSTGSVATGTV